MTAIIDYDAGNIKSVEKGVDHTKTARAEQVILGAKTSLFKQFFSCCKIWLFRGIYDLFLSGAAGNRSSGAFLFLFDFDRM